MAKTTIPVISAMSCISPEGVNVTDYCIRTEIFLVGILSLVAIKAMIVLSVGLS